MLPRYSKSSDSPADQAWREGKSPYSGTLGPNRTAADFTDAFVAKLRDNPDYNSFYTGSNFTQDVANQAQQKIDYSAQTYTPTFSNPNDNPFANDFLSKYTEGVARGLISEEDRVGPDKLAMLASQPATAGSSQKSPNTVAKFPGEGGIQVG
jgi:hypothetical protein